MNKASTHKADWYFVKNSRWQAELEALRNIVLQKLPGLPALQEEVKWGCPCYCLDGKNIVLIHTFKSYCALLFFKGVLFKDEDTLLIQQTKHVQAARQLRFVSLAEILQQKKQIKDFLKQAIAAEQAGTAVPMKTTREFEIVEEFTQALAKNAALKKAFFELTPGRQRAYLLYFSSAKQAVTRLARIKKYQPQILKGKGLDD